MEYNDLLNNLFNILDENNDIIRIKQLKKILLSDKSFLKKIKDYQEYPNIELKKELYKNENYIEYLKLETNINILLHAIKQKFNFKARSCFK